ncbi:MAG TPA: FHA domain-containing protein [Kofleriaceae bacterium]|nr:FHA domain-containing protein [Kofleriaceae bacterium]
MPPSDEPATDQKSLPPGGDLESGKTPAQTKPLAAAQRDAWFEGPDDITALRVYDGDVEYELPRRPMFTLGTSRSCDLPVPGSDLSALHCLLERKGNRLRVYDQHSTNGMFFGGRRVDVIDLYPGDTFTPAPVTFLAMNHEMRTHRPTIAEIVGTGFTPSPDRVLVDAVKHSSHLLITGEPGCDLDRLARAIHAVSLRRSRQLVELAELPTERARQRAIVKRATHSTLVIDLHQITASLDPTFCSMVFSSEYHVRVIVLAPTTNTARKLLPVENVEWMQRIWVRPLSERPGDLLDLLDRMLVERAAALRVADLTLKNQEALATWEWRDNFNGLRTAADRLATISRVQDWDTLDWRERAAATAIPRSTLHDWFTSLRLTLPLFT